MAEVRARRLPRAARYPHRLRPLTLAELAQLRRGVYRFLAATFLPPEPARVESLVLAARFFRENLEAFAGFSFYGLWQRLVETFAGDRVSDPDRLERAYAGLVVPSGRSSLPYEAAHLDPNRLLAGQIQSELEWEYRSAGLILRPDSHELPDHISVELEFMAFLCAREARAWLEEGLRGSGRRDLETEESFLRRHLSRWLPLFARGLRDVGHLEPYALAAEAASAFVHHDLDLVRLLLDKLEAT